MRRMLLVVLCHALLAGTAVASEAAALKSIQSADLQRHVDVLADDTFEGREAGSRGGRAAGVYLTKELAKFGIQPAGHEGSWYQLFSGRYRNILAMIPGSDPELKGEFLVVGAHYDHVGYGNSTNSYGPTGYIHNGADDNASGTATVLEVAEAFAKLETAPRRSILFAFWDGEEQGLLGSQHWLADPTVRLEQVRLAVNLDMVGRLRNKRLTVYGTRTSYGLRRQMSQAAGGTGMSLDFTWKLKNNSDHWSFYQRRIPVVMLHTGLHDDYHRPRDDAHKINAEGMQQVSKMLFQAIRAMADQPEPLATFRQRAEWESPYQRQELERPLAPLPTRLGVWWDKKDTTGPGLLVVKLDPGQAAQKAGVRVGDRMLTFAGRSLQHGDDLRAAVLAAPSSTQLTVQRDGEEDPIELKVELAGKPVRVGIAWREDDAEPQAVLLTRVVPGSPAGLAGLRVGERIYEFNGERFADTKDLLARLNAAQGSATLLVERAGQLRTVEFTLPELPTPRTEPSPAEAESTSDADAAPSETP